MIPEQTGELFKVGLLRDLIDQRNESFKSPIQKLRMSQKTWRSLVGYDLLRHQIQMEMEGNMTVYGIPVERDESILTGYFEALVKLSVWES